MRSKSTLPVKKELGVMLLMVPRRELIAARMKRMEYKRTCYTSAVTMSSHVTGAHCGRRSQPNWQILTRSSNEGYACRYKR
jgi:hypothetical protein